MILNHLHLVIGWPPSSAMPCRGFTLPSWNAQLARLFSEQKKALERFVVRRTGNRQVAADLAQESFLRMARMPDDRQPDDPRAFLFTVASNLIRDHQRQAGRREPLESEVPCEDVPCEAPTPLDQLASEREQRLMQAAIEALAEDSRRIFLLYHVDDLSYREIAERTGVTTRSVEYQLRRALMDCRAYVRKRQGASAGREDND